MSILDSNNRLIRSTPEKLGIKPSAILNMVEQWERLGGLHSFMILRYGKVAAEGWWKPYSADKRHMLFSLSKSFTSIASAFAAAEGLLDYENTVVSFFPEYTASIDNIDEKMKSMKVKHLLSMTTGHEPNADFIFKQEDCVKAFLESSLGHEPGKGFSYNTGATYMVSAIVQKVTGQKIIDYLEPRLFAPLGIKNIAWDECACGICYGGFGLNVKTEDIAKFGEFMRCRGMWDGKQLLPAELADAATCKHINNWGGSAYPYIDNFEPEIQPDDVRRSDWSQGYGRQFWRCVPEGVYRGDGAFGQLCVVMPKYEIVVACTAGLGDMQAELNAIWDNINDNAFCESDCSDSAAQSELEAKLASLTIPHIKSGGNTALRKYNGQKFCLKSNDLGFRNIIFEFGDNTDNAVIQCENDADMIISAGHGEWSDNIYTTCHDKNEAVSINKALSPDTPDSDDKFAAFSASASYEDNVLNIIAVQNLTPYLWKFRITFEGNTIKARIEYNVGGYAVDIEGEI